MYKNTFCPVSEKKIHTAVIRAHAILTVLILLIFLFTKSIYPALFLFADFLVRVLNFPRFSIMGSAAHGVVKIFSIKGKLENAGPKIFAARIGLSFTLVILVLLIFNITTAALALGVVLALFSLLEGVFGICVACIIYPWVYRLLYSQPNEFFHRCNR